MSKNVCHPNGVRTRITAVKGLRPIQLDDRAIICLEIPDDFIQGSACGIRTHEPLQGQLEGLPTLNRLYNAPFV